MIRYSLLLVLLLLLACTSAGATEPVENPKACQQCSMDRVAFARSRMLITYGDGTVTGVCSLRCAVENLVQNEGKEVKSLQVADFPSSTLIDAKTAIWVVGGKLPGGMNNPARWAFAKQEDAEAFVRENGGELSTLDRMVNLAGQGDAAEHGAGHVHQHAHMGGGGQMLFNPAFGDDIYHAHPAGMWMVNYKYMHMVQKGLRNGTTDVPTENATPVGNQPFGFMMAPTRMTMDMHMVMVMYGLTDRLTLMGMGNYLESEMAMVMNMGMGNQPDAPMRTSGPGDSELRGIYQLGEHLTASLGLGLPTGDIDQTIVAMGKTFRAPYDMQLGSGTIDLKPALTCNVLSDDAKWNWGGQASYTYHTGRNGNGYSLGDSAKLNGWLQRALGPAAAWTRLAYNYADRIDGRDPEIAKLLDPLTGAPTPDADPRNYGGHRVDGFLGASYAAGPVSIGIEAGIPLYQYLHGLQLKNDWYLTAGLQGMF